MEKWKLKMAWDPFKRGGGKVGDPRRHRRSVESDLHYQARRELGKAEVENYELAAMLYYRNNYPGYLNSILSYAFENEVSFVEAQMNVSPPEFDDEDAEFLKSNEAPAYLIQALLYGHFD